MVISEDDIRKRYNAVRTSAEYRDRTDAECRAIAKALVEADEKELKVDFLKSAKERKLAKNLIKKYVADYFIETAADKMMVKHLVYLEVTQARLQDQLNELYGRDKVVPAQMMDIMQKNIESITKVRSALGLTKSQRNVDKGEEAKALELLKQKFTKWRSENQASRTLKCPHCTQMILLKIKTDVWEAQRHPYLKDNILTNEHLIRLYIEKKLTRFDLAQVLQTSEDYIDWLVARWEDRESGQE